MRKFIIELNEWINETCENDLIQKSYFWTVVLCLLTSPIYGVWGCLDEKIGTIWGVSVIGFLLFTDKNGSVRKFCFDNIKPVQELIVQLNHTGTISRKFMIDNKVIYVRL